MPPTVHGPISDPVNRAMIAVDRDVYVCDPDGTVVPQSSSDRVIASLLDQLDVKPGMSVFEIGTGSGYSTALLAHLVGRAGQVASIDIDPVLVDRAADLLEQRGVTNASVTVGHGATDLAMVGAGFDRIIAWATADHIPSAWVDHAAPEAVIVAPVQLSRLAMTPGIVRLRLDTHRRPSGDRLTPGGFVPLHDTARPQWAVPPRNVDALVRDGDDNPWWLSAYWLRQGNPAEGEDLLRQLIGAHDSADSPLADDENSSDFHIYLAAAQPDGLTTAALGGPLWRVGHTTPTSAALVPTGHGRDLIRTTDPTSVDTLTAWVHDWRRRGRPGHDNIDVELMPDADGWIVRARLPAPDRPSSGRGHPADG